MHVFYCTLYSVLPPFVAGSTSPPAAFCAVSVDNNHILSTFDDMRRDILRPEHGITCVVECSMMHTIRAYS